MRIIVAHPPNFQKIVAVFPKASDPSVLFCYGDSVYMPGGGGISEALLAHEAVHSRRQGDEPEAWWDRYLAEAQFRFDEELLAHVEEYRVASRGLARPGRRHALKNIVERLSGPLYGRVASAEHVKRAVLALTNGA